MKKIQEKKGNVNITSDPFLYAILQITEIALTKDAQERFELAKETIEDLEQARLEVYPFQRI